MLRQFLFHIPNELRQFCWVGHKYWELVSLRKVSIESTLDWQLMKSNEKTKYIDWIAPPSSQYDIKRVKSARVEIFCLPYSITLRYSQIFNSCLSYISCIQGKGLLVVSCLLHLNSRILKPLLHVVTFSWNLGATALHRFRRCCTVLHGMFHETFFYLLLRDKFHEN